MKTVISFSLNLLILILILHTNVISCFDYTNSRGYITIRNTITLTGHSYWVSDIISLNNGDFASCGDKSIIIWDSVFFSIKRVLNDHTDYVNSLALLANEDLVSGSADWTIKIWDLQTGIPKRTLTGHTYSVRCLVSLSNDSLASGSDDKTIKIWNPSTGQLLKTINALDYFLSLALLPNGYLVCGYWYGHTKIWDPKTGLLKHNISIDGSHLYSQKVLKSGDLASTFNNYVYGTYGIQIRDPLSFDLIAYYIGHSDYVRDIVELPNGDLASGSEDKTIKIWDRTTGNVIKTDYFHTDTVTTLAVLKNGLLASGSGKTIVISKI